MTSHFLYLRSLCGVVALAGALVIGGGAAQAQTKPKLASSGVEKPASMVWIGNNFFQYNSSIPSHFLQLLKAGDPGYTLRQSSETISAFGWHDMEATFRPKRQSLQQNFFPPAAGSESSPKKPDRLFDLVLMMDCPQCPIHPQFGSAFAEYAKKYSDIVRRNGAKPVFFMSWAYADKPEMTDQIAEAYVKAANENDAYVVPAGLAFARSVKERPDINLYDADKRHPSLAGTYLAACTVYAAIFKKSPVGLKYTAGLAPEIAAHLQKVADETVKAFYP